MKRNILTRTDQLLFVLLTCLYLLSPSTRNILASSPKQGGYEYNPEVPLSVWSELEPFFLPLNHPLKAKLDLLFKDSRITLSKETFEHAGFVKIKERAPTNIIVGRHPSLGGYLLKVFFDTQPAVCEWCNWRIRILGALAIRECIERNGFGKMFKVPKKWIYPLQREIKPNQSAAYKKKHFILVVEKMNILSTRKNLDAYKNKIKPSTLNALFTILREVGLLDSVFPDNIPFDKKGRINFVDTEHHHHPAIPFHKLSKYLSPSMRRYWESLINQNAP